MDQRSIGVFSCLLEKDVDAPRRLDTERGRATRHDRRDDR
jgi:hypothetical protein